MKNNLRVLFLGTPDFAVPSLEMLVKEGYEVIGVVTQPDKPKGRGHKLSPPPIKSKAIEYGLEVFQPVKIKDPEFVKQLEDLKPDLMITAAYGQILSKAILDIPKFGCINVHASLLPKYRGAAPIQWAVIQGEKVTGITTMYTDVGLDTGDMAIKKEINIGETETYKELHDRLADLGAETLSDTLRMLQEGSLPRIPQNAADSTYFPLIRKELGQIKWEKTSFEIFNLVRGVNPWPGAYTFYKNNKMRIWKCIIMDKIINKNNVPGTILKVDKSGIMTATEDGAVLIEEIQFDGSRRMKVSEYIAGHNLDEGTVFSEVQSVG